MPTVSEIKAKYSDQKEQYQILLWTEKALRPLANPAEYERLCQMEDFHLTPEVFNAIYEALEPFAAGGTPGHDRGHHLRDLLGVSAIIGNDPVVAQAYPNDVVAGFIAGSFHDAGCAVLDRYKDGDGWIGHDLAGAKIVYDVLEGLAPEHIRLLVAYAIACHTHALKPVDTKIGYIREVWEDRLFYNLGRPVRIAVWLTRFADRLDTNGVTLLARHIVAQLDSYVYKGEDLSGTATYVADDIMLKLLMKPEAVLEGKTPSTLMHIKRFADSNDQSKIGAYNQHDGRFPVMNRLITTKSDQAVALVETIGKDSKAPGANANLVWDFLKYVSNSDETDSVKDSFVVVWNSLTTKEQKKWGPGIAFAYKEYNNWLDLLKKEVQNSSLPLVTELIPSIMEIVKGL